MRRIISIIYNKSSNTNYNHMSDKNKNLFEDEADMKPNPTTLRLCRDN